MLHQRATTCPISQRVALAVDDSSNSPASLQAGDAVPGVQKNVISVKLNPGFGTAKTCQRKLLQLLQVTIFTRPVSVVKHRNAQFPWFFPSTHFCCGRFPCHGPRDAMLVTGGLPKVARLVEMTTSVVLRVSGCHGFHGVSPSHHGPSLRHDSFHGDFL